MYFHDRLPKPVNLFEKPLRQALSRLNQVLLCELLQSSEQLRRTRVVRHFRGLEDEAQAVRQMASSLVVLENCLLNKSVWGYVGVASLRVLQQAGEVALRDVQLLRKEDYLACEVVVDDKRLLPDLDAS